MTEETKEIHPDFSGLLPRNLKETHLNQRGHVFWFYGLSGSGKSTLAYALEKQLFAEGFFVQVLDGDNVRTGLNSNLGFSDEDRSENIRRISEVAKLFAQSGVITLVSFITPKIELRERAKAVIGEKDFTEIFVEASYETCAERDVKGLYAKAKSGELKQFTGKDSAFEAPVSDKVITVNTELSGVEDCSAALLQNILPLIQFSE
ncbi:MAG: adenylyl-sulfate kinase [Verrucomicrobia bacterium]|nr:adenylyl-sulfate kinase [Verrucomicrobiota bacterium]MDA1066713.1 adenylyl-sulfate kinase [Verrucomicrobiota bacterium]